MKQQLSFTFVLLFALTVLPSLVFGESNTASASQMNNETPKNNQPEGLHPVVAESAEILKQRAADKGIVIRFTDDFRSFEEQDKLYEQGRTEPGNIVTNAKGGQSYHNYGLAVDYAIEVNGNVIWDVEYDGNGNGKSDWFEVAQMAKELGFTWGGDWEDFVDYPHLQMEFGYSLHDLQTGNHYLF